MHGQAPAQHLGEQLEGFTATVSVHPRHGDECLQGAPDDTDLVITLRVGHELDVVLEQLVPDTGHSPRAGHHGVDQMLAGAGRADEDAHLPISVGQRHGYRARGGR